MIAVVGNCITIKQPAAGRFEGGAG